MKTRQKHNGRIGWAHGAAIRRSNRTLCASWAEHNQHQSAWSESESALQSGDSASLRGVIY